MRVRVPVLISLGVGVWLLMSPDESLAQTAVSGSISGAVRDSTGAVLPGVTVEASSPALIEKVRSATTDGQGLFTIVNLTPGTYSVKFELAGFSTVIRDGIQLSTGFNATANAEMNVGAVTETITVTGATPLVDLRNTNAQAVISRDLLDSVPTAQNFAGLASITVGVGGARDVGGSSGDGVAALTASGGTTDGAYQLDGVAANSISVAGSSRRYQMNQAAVQEVVLNMRGAGADTETGGVTSNVVMKEGGNSFRGSFDGDYTGPGLYNQNLTQDLRDRGLTQVNDLRKIYSAGGGIGGPIKRDRIWFYGAYRAWSTEQYLAGVFYNGNTDPRRLFYTPDQSRRAYTSTPVKDFSGRVTIQAGSKSKISIFDSNQTSCSQTCTNGSATFAPEAFATLRIGPSLIMQGTWNYTASSRMLIEAGSAVRSSNVNNLRQPGVLDTDTSVLNSATGFRYNAIFTTTALQTYGNQGRGTGWTHSAALNYVTGTHQVKTGFTVLMGNSPATGELNDPPIGYRFNGLTPTTIDMAAMPSYVNSKVKYNLGLYAQDKWTLHRVTLNLGVRFDALNSNVPAQTRPGGIFLPEMHFDEVKDVPNWRDINPRLGATYDVFGSGRTALKGTIGRYVIGEASNYAQANSPANRLNALTSRTWNDWDGDYIPDCDITNFAANGALGGPLGNQPECGAVPGGTFGTPVFTATYDPDLLHGWYTRPYQWTMSAGVEHQLFPRVGLDVTYNRNWRGNTTVTDNRALNPSDYDPYCVTAPTNSGLGSVSGTEICGLYDITPAAAARAQDNFVTHTNGSDKNYYNGVDVSLSARFGRGGLLSGGGSFGNFVADNCLNIVDSPNPNATLANATFSLPNAGFPAQFCRIETTSSDFKLAVSYPIVWDIHVAANYQNLLAPTWNATQVYTNAEISRSLGRNLGVCLQAVVCNQTVTVTLLEPNKEREDRAQQVDLRFSKLVRVGRTRVRGRFDIYNLMNADDVLLQQSAVALLRRPTSVLSGRTFKLGANVEF